MFELVERRVVVLVDADEFLLQPFQLVLVLIRADQLLQSYFELG